MEQEQPTRVGRRLAAIVAADAAGYSRLMGLDEVGTARTLHEHREITDAVVAEHPAAAVGRPGKHVHLVAFALERRRQFRHMRRHASNRPPVQRLPGKHRNLHTRVPFATESFSPKSKH